MLRNAMLGMVAGAAGTLALDVVTYADMTLRGRPASSVPAKLAGVLAAKAGVDLQAGVASDEQVANRKSGIGALLGYATGVGFGVVFGLLRPHLRDISGPIAGAGLGLTVMAANAAPMAATGVSDPRTWSAKDWLSDLIPHLAYGVFTALAFDAATRERSNRPG